MVFIQEVFFPHLIGKKTIVHKSNVSFHHFIEMFTYLVASPMGS